MSSLIRLVMARFSQKGVCRKCGTERDHGSHQNCDRTRAELTYTGNTVDTTVADLKKLVDLLPQKHHVFFRLQIAGVVEPLLDGPPPKKRKMP